MYVCICVCVCACVANKRQSPKFKVKSPTLPIANNADLRLDLFLAWDFLSGSNVSGSCWKPNDNVMYCMYVCTCVRASCKDTPALTLLFYFFIPFFLALPPKCTLESPSWAH